MMRQTQKTLIGGKTMNETITRIIEAASDLTHEWIILDALKDDNDINEGTYMEVIYKIAEIEATYTDEEIEENNLLCDIW
jgi:hypothetical protein